MRKQGKGRVDKKSEEIREQKCRMSEQRAARLRATGEDLLEEGAFPAGAQGSRI